MKYFMTIDAGTGSGRAVIIDEFGNQVGIGQTEWSHKSNPKHKGSMNFDCKANWDILVNCIKEAINNANINPKDIEAISTSSMREGIVVYDKDLNEIWAVANVDSRAFEEVSEINNTYPTLEKEFYNLSGQTFALGAIPRLLWLKKNEPNLYDKMYKMNMLSDWILFKLSGELVSEPSNAGTSGIFNLNLRTWQNDMMTKVNLKDDIFPKVYESGEIIGTVSSEFVKLTGLSESCVVVTGGGDVQLGSLGLGVVKSGDSAILGGTFWQQIVNLDKVVVDSNMKLRINPHVQRNLIQAEGITFFVGLVTRWFRDVFCDLEKMEAIKRGVDTYEILEELAGMANVGSNGVMPIFSDVMNYGKWYHASPSFLNLNINPEICSKKEMFRAILENACIVSSINLDNIINFSGVKIDSLTFAGGASKGKLWGQILADVTKKSIKVPVVKEATSLGGAMLGAVATGFFKDSHEACQNWVKFEKSFEPNLKNSEIYDEIKQNWQIAYKKQLDLVDMNITESMWKAPGV